LATTGLVFWKRDVLESEAVENVEGGQADLRLQLVDVTGNEEGDTHRERLQPIEVAHQKRLATVRAVIREPDANVTFECSGRSLICRGALPSITPIEEFVPAAVALTVEPGVSEARRMAII
jgi:hypothetical protein